jgi:predicted TPR repeat methyltransferase
MNTHTTIREFFEELYLHDDDPWSFGTSEYELGRYQTTLQALANRRYQRAFEPGCSIGVLTEQLAMISDRVEAIDISSMAVEQAARRCGTLSNVSIRQGALPTDVPSGSFDLIVFSEIGYYFDERQLEAMVDRLIDHMQSGSVFLAVHWLGSSPDHILNGSNVHKIISCSPRLAHEHSEDHTKYLLDRWICK